MTNDFQTPTRRIYSISELTEKIKALLEENYPFIWISGEISNLRIPSSGHCYLTLKDSGAQIAAVIFRNQKRRLDFDLEDGIRVTGLGRITVYPPRGAYQIILEFVEPAGLGALQAAFEQLKRRLAEEGLFDPAHKKPLPSLPRRIAVVTSATGAALQDILTVSRRRFPNLEILVAPVPVQGDQAADRIAEALVRVDAMEAVDVVILARGGGSLEDLQPFNTETVARAVFAASVPVVSAVGHETDVTIADFVADLRAPTPSAAAELVVPLKSELFQRCCALENALKSAMARIAAPKRDRVRDLRKRLVHPGRRIQDLRLRLDDATGRVCRSLRQRNQRNREHLQWMTHRLIAASPVHRIHRLREDLAATTTDLSSTMAGRCRDRRVEYRRFRTALDALNPMAILARGYSITRRLPDRTVVRGPEGVKLGQEVEITLARGRLRTRVTDKE